MANKLNSGLNDARQKGQLRKDAQVQGRRSSIGKRETTSSLSSGSQSSSSTSTVSGTSSLSSNRNITSSSSSSSKIDTQRRFNQQRNNRLISAAEKVPIPIVRKAAQAAKLAKKIKAAKDKKAGFLGNLLGSKSSNPSAAELEDAKGAEDRGEDYEPEDTEGRYSASLDRKTKQLFAAFVLGIVGICVFLCLITTSAITGGAKESYLASHDNPTEEELAQAYAIDAANGGTSSSSAPSSSFASGGSIKTDSLSNVIMVGDSRTVMLCLDVYNGSSCETLGYKVGNTTFIAGVGESYVWFHGTALPMLKELLNSNPKSTVFINLGTNGFDDADKYAADYNQLAKDYPNTNIIAVSVAPVIDEKVTEYKDVDNDANAVKFNNSLKGYLSSDVTYCDIYSQLKGKVDASDGIHYDEASDKLVDEAMKNCLVTSSVSGTGTLNADGTLASNNNAPSGVYEISSEPEPWSVINYWDNLNKDDFIYPVDKATNLPLGAWPKDYKNIPTQLSGCKLYQNAFIWPATPEGGVYEYVYEHLGIDIMSDFGTPIYSPVDGTLVYSEWGHTTNKGSDETAYSVTISPDTVVNYNGTSIDEIFMTHMSGIRYRCSWGECNRKVKKGELVGFIGTAAGDSTDEGYASHLHMTFYPEDDYGSGLYTPSMESFYSISAGTRRNACE